MASWIELLRKVRKHFEAMLEEMAFRLAVAENDPDAVLSENPYHVVILRKRIDDKTAKKSIDLQPRKNMSFDAQRQHNLRSDLARAVTGWTVKFMHLFGLL